MPGAREVPTGREADARGGAGAPPGGLARPPGAKASGSKGLREQGRGWSPNSSRATDMPSAEVLPGHPSMSPQRRAGPVPTPRPTCAYRCSRLKPPTCGFGPQAGEAVCPGALQPASPGPLLVGESAPRRLAQTPARAQEGPPAALSAVPACEAGLAPRGAGSRPPGPPSGAWPHLTVHLS